MTLEELRGLIDQINEEIIALFAKRLEITTKIARVKKQTDLPIDDPVREEEQTLQLRAIAKRHHLSPAVIEEIFHQFIDYTKMRMKLEKIE